MHRGGGGGRGGGSGGFGGGSGGFGRGPGGFGRSPSRMGGPGYGGWGYGRGYGPYGRYYRRGFWGWPWGWSWGWGWGWGSPYGYGGWTWGIANCVCCIMVIVIFGVVIIAGALYNASTTTNPNINMAPNETRLIKLDNYATSVQITLNTGNINTYFFRSTPPLSIFNTYTYNDSFPLSNNYYQSETAYLNKGSVANVTWSTNSVYNVEYYVVQGDSNFAAWQNGDSVYNRYILASTDTDIYNVEASDQYYFVWYNSIAVSMNINLSIIYTTANYEVSGALVTYSGNNNIDIHGQGYTYMIIQNPSTTNDANMQYTIILNYNIAIWLPIVIVVCIGIIAIVVVIDKKKGKKNPPNLNQQNMAQQDFNPQKNPQINPTPDINFQQPLQIPTQCSNCGRELDQSERESYQQHGKIYCQNCGFEIL